MNPAQRASVAGVALFAAAVGATAGFAAERVVVGRRLRRGVPAGDASVSGQLRGPPRIVACEDGVELHVEVDEAHPSAPWRDLTVVFVHGYALNQDCFHFQGWRCTGRRVWCSTTSDRTADPAGSSGSATLVQLAHDLRTVIDDVAPLGRWFHRSLDGRHDHSGARANRSRALRRPDSGGWASSRALPARWRLSLWGYRPSRCGPFARLLRRSFR